MVTEMLGKYIKHKGISIKRIAEVTGLNAQKLYDSFDANKTRQLKADEFLLVCRFLEVNPYDFFVQKDSNSIAV